MNLLPAGCLQVIVGHGVHWRFGEPHFGYVYQWRLVSKRWDEAVRRCKDVWMLWLQWNSRKKMLKTVPVFEQVIREVVQSARRHHKKQVQQQVERLENAERVVAYLRNELRDAAHTEALLSAYSFPNKHRKIDF